MLALHILLQAAIELVFYLGLGTLLWHLTSLSPGQLCLLALAAALGVRGFVVLFNFAFAWLHRMERPPALRIGPLRALRQVAAEFAATLALYFSLHPFEHWLGQRNPVATLPRQGPPVLLIHGFLCNGGFWLPLQRYLQKRGLTQLYTINLEPLYGDIDGFAEQVKARVEAICNATGAERVVLVGHSMGGLVARAYLQCSSARARVAKIITLGSPHHGTEHARLTWGANVRQMRPGNPWLAELNQAPPTPVPFTSIYSCHDNIIAPQDSSILPHAKTIPLSGIGHVAMAFSKPIQTLVYDEISSLGPIAD